MQTRRNAGYTLMEMLVVLGIILTMTSMALLSVTVMLRHSRMSRAQSIIVTSADEARTAAITLRRSTSVDLTPLDPSGKYNRLTIVGPFFNEDFEHYRPVPPGDPANAELAADWISDSDLEVVSDGTRCLKLAGAGKTANYYSMMLRPDNMGEDYELMLQARIKMLSNGTRTTPRTVGILGCVQDSSGTGSVDAAYRLSLTIVPASGPFGPDNPNGRNNSSTITLDKVGAGELQAVDIDTGAPSATCNLIENVWYRVLLSVKHVTPHGGGPRWVTVAGKVWADGQLEPVDFTVGPLVDPSTPLSSGFAGFTIDDCDAHVDDVLFDLRPIRPIPENFRIDTYQPLAGKTDPSSAADYAMVPQGVPSVYGFPLMFRPDGTSTVKNIIRLTDTSSGNVSFVVIEPNTGRTRIVPDLNEAAKK